MRRFIVCFVLLLAFAMLNVSTALAVPDLLSYQGVLNDAGGNPVSATVSMTFKLYDVETGGTELWSETQSVQAANGVFNVQLGSMEPLMTSVAQRDELYLGIQVGADPEMVPRQRMTTGAFAYRASVVEQQIVPVGTVLAWVKHFKTTEKFTDPNTYGGYKLDSLRTWKVGFAFSGQDLINSGIEEGDAFQFDAWTRRVVVDGSPSNYGYYLYMNPSTIVPGAAVTGTSLGGYNTSSTSFIQSPRLTVAPNIGWNASTQFAVVYYSDGVNSSHDVCSQFHTFTVYTNNVTLPFGWVECNGQTLNDPESLYDGMTVPDLNVSSRFLRGSKGSGGTGGASYPLTSRGTSGSSPVYGPNASKTTNLPPYYDVVWVMKVK